MKKTVVFTACDMTNANACPQVVLDHSADPTQEVVITDDFNGAAKMNKIQFGLIVQAAKEGKFDNIIA